MDKVFGTGVSHTCSGAKLLVIDKIFAITDMAYLCANHLGNSFEIALITRFQFLQNVNGPCPLLAICTCLCLFWIGVAGNMLAKTSSSVLQFVTLFFFARQYTTTYAENNFAAQKDKSKYEYSGRITWEPHHWGQPTGQKLQ